MELPVPLLGLAASGPCAAGQDWREGIDPYWKKPCYVNKWTGQFQWAKPNIPLVVTKVVRPSPAARSPLGQ